MFSSSLAAPEARARYSIMMIAGAVVVASAISQAVANPISAYEPSFLPEPASIQAPVPTVTPIDAAQQAAAVAVFAFHAPTPGYAVNSPFGLRRLPWEPRGRMHEGVDIAAPRGLQVGATLAGVVTRAGSSPTYGRFVEMRHADGLTSLYGHLGSIRRGLKPGARLAAGEAVGIVGNTGRSTGEHLHFEIRAAGRPLNPALFMGKTFANADDLPLNAAARFSRRVRLAVVSPQALAKMMPQKVGAPVGAEAVKPTRDGRVRAVLPPSYSETLGDPSPQQMKAASPAPPPTTPTNDAPMATARGLDDFSAQRLENAG